LTEARERLLSSTAEEHVVTADVISAVESDIALTIAVLRLANSNSPAGGAIDTVRAAVELLGADHLHELAGCVPTFDFFESAGIWRSAPERFRLHSTAVQRAADRIASEIGYEDRDRLAVSSLLHDIGRGVMILAYPGFCDESAPALGNPDERIHRECRELGVDHAVLGGALMRRWGLPASLTIPVERHHEPESEGEAAVIRLADMLAHYEHGDPVSVSDMRESATALGLGADDLRRIIWEPSSVAQQRPRHVDECPLTRRELAVLQGLARGGVYKQIAHELALSVSTIRTHLHNIYGKLGAVDRAQAVLIANERGWLQ
jgi:putative nucleotidyltransferase with HDIG domain